MTLFQTALYRAIFIDGEIGWDVDPAAVFESVISDNPTLAMQEFDFYEPLHNNWFGTMRVIEDGEVIEEEWFDSSVVDIY